MIVANLIVLSTTFAQYCNPFTTINDQNGTLASQDSNISSYRNNLQCQWVIRSASPNGRIKLVLREFNTECGWDYLTLFDGDSKDSPTLARLCGNRNLPGFSNTIVSNTNSLFLEFTSDNFAVASGFQIDYEILDFTSPCLSDTDCFRGRCLRNSCACPTGFSGLLCESRLTDSTIFTPRERHSVAYDSENDIAYISFGMNFGNNNDLRVLSDLMVYNFTSRQFRALFPTGGQSQTLARFDHKSWYHEGKLYVYGGRSRNLQYVDLWVYDSRTNNWESLYPPTPQSLIETFEPIAIFMPLVNGCEVYVYGGVSLKTAQAQTNLYRFDCNSKSWTVLSTFGPISYRGGYGVYHKESHSIRFLNGYTSLGTGGSYYTYEYSIHSGTWSVLAPRPGQPILYQAPALQIGNEVALVQGGQSPDSVTTCFQSLVEILDLACNEWAKIQSNPIIPRKGHGIVYRNNSLWLFGGSDGILQNDVVEIPLRISLLPNATRNSCRGTLS